MLFLFLYAPEESFYFLFRFRLQYEAYAFYHLSSTFEKNPEAVKYKKKQLIVINSIWSGFFEKNRKYRIEFTTFVDVDSAGNHLNIPILQSLTNINKIYFTCASIDLHGSKSVYSLTKYTG